MNARTTLAAINALSAADLIVNTVAYVDTVEVVFFPTMPSDLQGRLKRLNEGRLKPRRPKKRDRRYLRRGQIWFLQQPTPEALLLLARCKAEQSGMTQVCRVDIAVDFICRTLEDAKVVGHFLRRHVRQKWHGNAFATTYENTTYAGPAKKARNLAIYADKPSKATGQPCAHLELRFRTFKKCRDKGFDDFDRLANGLCAMTLLEEETCLDVIAPERFDQFLERFAKATKRSNRRFENWLVEEVREAITVLIARSLQNEFTTFKPGTTEGVHVQDAYDRLKKLRRSLIRIEWDEFTDPPEWLHRRVVNTNNRTLRQ